MRVLITQLDAPAPIPAAVATGIQAQPGGQSAATPLAAVRNIVTVVSTNCGVLLQPVTGGYQQVVNPTAYPLLVYPTVGTAIAGNAQNVAVLIPPGGAAGFTWDNIGTWYES